jgi:hypothetical protein
MRLPSPLPPGCRLIQASRLSVETVAPPRLDGATRGAPQALQIADRGPLLHNLGEALEKVLVRHHADLKRVFKTEGELVEQKTPVLSLEKRTHEARRPSQAEQVQQARRERRLATFTQVHELSAQGWSFASIARQLGMNKKTVRTFALV